MVARTGTSPGSEGGTDSQGRDHQTQHKQRPLRQQDPSDHQGDPREEDGQEEPAVVEEGPSVIPGKTCGFRGHGQGGVVLEAPLQQQEQQEVEHQQHLPDAQHLPPQGGEGALLALPQDALDQQVAPQGHPGPGEEGGQDAGQPRGGVPPGEGLGEEEGQGIRPDDQAGEDAVNQPDHPHAEKLGGQGTEGGGGLVQHLPDQAEVIHGLGQGFGRFVHRKLSFQDYSIK